MGKGKSGGRMIDHKSLAFIIDGEVISVARYDERTASILLSNPTIIDVTPIAISEGWQYDDSVGFYTNIDGQEVTVDPTATTN